MDSFLPFLDYVILLSAVSGIVINVAAFVILARKKKERQLRRSSSSSNSSGGGTAMFHDLLRLLMVYDVFVVVCCLLQFALPSLWPGYYASIRPHVVPWLLPIMHIAVMSSVYCTILISFERYIRICYLCQLRPSSLLTEDNIKYYKLFLLLFPTTFYIPKFFEVYTQPEVVSSKTFNCERYLDLANRLQQSQEELDRFQAWKRLSDEQIASIISLGRRCYLLNYNDVEDDENNGGMMQEGEQRRPLLNLTLAERMTPLSIEPTQLRMDKHYYRIYYVFLNTLFASLLPLALLLFLNMRTATELFKMGRRDQAAARASAAITTAGLNGGGDRGGGTGGGGSDRGSSRMTGVVMMEGGVGSPCLSNTVEIVNQNENNLEMRTVAANNTTEEEEEEESELEDTTVQSPLTATTIATTTTTTTASSSPSSPSALRRISSTWGERRRGLRASFKNLQRKTQRSSSAVSSGGNNNNSGSSNESRERKLAYISLYIVWLFIFCHVWKLIPTAYEVATSEDDVGLVVSRWPMWVRVVEKISHTLITVNSSMNFLIYMVI